MMTTQGKEKQLKYIIFSTFKKGGHYSLWCQISPKPVI